MPQLEQIDTFVSQLIWLTITFVSLYIVLRLTALPRIGELLDERQRRVEGSLEKAARLKEEAEKIIADYEATLAEARNSARVMAKKVVDDATIESSRRHDELGEVLAQRVKAAESTIATAKKQALDGVMVAAGDAAKAATAKLAGVTIDDTLVQAAVPAALRERG